VILTRFVEQTFGLHSRETLFALLTAFLGERGIEVWSYHLLTQNLVSLKLERGLLHATFPADWVARYASEGYFDNDPIIAHARRARTPYRWWDLEADPALTAAERAYLAEARRHLRDGYGVPVNGALGTVAYFGVGSLSHDLDLDEAALTLIQFACHQTHLRFLQLHGEFDAPLPRLSPREKEVLGWVVRGKSNAVIAELLQVSEHTIDSLMRRIYRKLNVADRTSAALRAVGSGLIAA
jgi:DNA-binding CsgD family transcriptional regulator